MSKQNLIVAIIAIAILILGYVLVSQKNTVEQQSNVIIESEIADEETDRTATSVPKVEVKETTPVSVEPKPGCPAVMGGSCPAGNTGSFVLENGCRVFKCTPN